jgi:DNA-binding GntR family transcriptional regulator
MQQTLVEKSYRYLREKLAHGELGAGSQLVNRTLAAAIGVSLGPLREAINRLASEGLIEQVPGAGAFVRKPSRQELEDLYALLESVEGTAAADACRLIGDLQLEELDRLCADWNQLAEELQASEGQSPNPQQMERWANNEERFHSIVVEAARNMVLAKVIREHRMLARVFGAQRLQATALTSAIVSETAKDHCELIAALRRRDADAARSLTSQKVQKERRAVVRLFGAAMPDAVNGK